MRVELRAYIERGHLPGSQYLKSLITQLEIIHDQLEEKDCREITGLEEWLSEIAGRFPALSRSKAERDLFDRYVSIIQTLGLNPYPQGILQYAADYIQGNSTSNFPIESEELFGYLNSLPIFDNPAIKYDWLPPAVSAFFIKDGEFAAPSTGKLLPVGSISPIENHQNNGFKGIYYTIQEYLYGEVSQGYHHPYWMHLSAELWKQAAERLTRDLEQLTVVSQFLLTLKFS